MYVCIKGFVYVDGVHMRIGVKVSLSSSSQSLHSLLSLFHCPFLEVCDPILCFLRLQSFPQLSLIPLSYLKSSRSSIPNFPQTSLSSVSLLPSLSDHHPSPIQWLIFPQPHSAFFHPLTAHRPPGAALLNNSNPRGL